MSSACYLPLVMLGCSEQALSHTASLEISVYTCFFSLQLQQYLERVTLTERAFCVSPRWSAFLSLINGPLSNPPLIFCNMT